MDRFFTEAVLVATIATGIKFATPYLLAALGETIGQRSGVLNLGVDGVMLLGAFGAYYTVLETDSHWLGALVGIGVGLAMGIVYAIITVYFHAEQGISGIGIFLFGLGFSDLLFEELVGTPRPIRVLPKVELPLLADIPIVGEALFQHNMLTYLAFLLVPLVTLLMRRTTFGLEVKAVGENPEAADSLGVSVTRTRFKAILIGNVMAGLAGASLAMQLAIFQPFLTQGLGFIAVALVYFGAWQSRGVMAGALLYGLVTATRLSWQALQIIPTDLSELAAVAPAVITVIALALIASKVKPPSALTKPFQRH